MKCPGCGVDLMGGMKECPKCKYDTRYPGGGEKYRKYKEEQFNAAQAKAREEEDKARAAERRVTAQMDAYYSMIANIDYVTILNSVISQEGGGGVYKNYVYYSLLVVNKDGTRQLVEGKEEDIHYLLRFIRTPIDELREIKQLLQNR